MHTYQSSFAGVWSSVIGLASASATQQRTTVPRQEDVRQVETTVLVPDFLRRNSAFSTRAMVAREEQSLTLSRLFVANSLASPTPTVNELGRLMMGSIIGALQLMEAGFWGLQTLYY
eukprot:CAMPEP_0194058244 /NCGR_PEP_ID=MMETSP0009_2-20130614/65681_1 /TAXON_ID=210454 /ORGANISM="Grammatophora oceanica, Strain CCMP 410" /LENGTH=116 /DNA_ID=CAMNT_0038708311 /DNA_START=409 /DNA_END=759 /DNA_ORIENTATION=+